MITVPTALGDLGVSWSPDGITSVVLPSARRVRRRSRRTSLSLVLPPDAPPFLKKAVAALTGYLAGRRVDLGRIPVDLGTSAGFARAIYDELRRVPRGTTVTYGELASRVGAPGGARAVGGAVGRNPVPLLVPCHRVLAAGSLGGFSGGEGLATKVDLLALEGLWLPGRLLGLPFEPRTAVAALGRSDPRLRAAMRRHGPLRLMVEPSEAPYESLFSAIVHQQLAGAAAAAILRRVTEGLGEGRIPAPEVVLSASEEGLRALGLSRNKALALRSLAGRTLDGTVPTAAAAARMTDDELVERLVTIRGVGRWTVEMFLIFTLGRPDVFPADDFGVRSGLRRLDGLEELPSAKEAAARAAVWEPHRSVAAWYLWRVAGEEGA